VDALTEHETGWGVYPTILFRFSGDIDFDTFRSGDGKPSPVLFLDITDPKVVGNAGADWNYSSAKGKYVCENWLAIRRPVGAPLEPGRVYVAYMTTAGKAKGGGTIQRSDH